MPTLIKLAKTKQFLLLLAALSIGLVANPAATMISSVVCNQECRAQALVKNSVFYEMRGIIGTVKQRGESISPQYSVQFSPQKLYASGIALTLTTPSGDFVLTSRSGDLAMLATAENKRGRIEWQCRFFSNSIATPAERPCSF
jgi:hypothetical protein